MNFLSILYKPRNYYSDSNAIVTRRNIWFGNQWTHKQKFRCNAGKASGIVTITPLQSKRYVFLYVWLALPTVECQTWKLSGLGHWSKQILHVFTFSISVLMTILTEPFIQTWYVTSTVAVNGCPQGCSRARVRSTSAGSRSMSRDASWNLVRGHTTDAIWTWCLTIKRKGIRRTS